MTGSDIASLSWHPYRPHLFDDDGCFDSVHHHMHVRRAATRGRGRGCLTSGGGPQDPVGASARDGAIDDCRDGDDRRS
jgi:hypothetical protein